MIKHVSMQKIFCENTDRKFSKKSVNNGNKKAELMLKIRATAVCNRCKVSMPISVVFLRGELRKWTVRAHSIYPKVFQNAPNVARSHVRNGRASCAPRSRLWDVAPNQCWCQKTRGFVLPHSEDHTILLHSSAYNNSPWQTEGQTDGFAVAITHLALCAVARKNERSFAPQVQQNALREVIGCLCCFWFYYVMSTQLA